MSHLLNKVGRIYIMACNYHCCRDFARRGATYYSEEEFRRIIEDE